MAEPLEFDALIAPIPGDNPAGQELPYEVRQELDESRKEPDPLEPSTADRRADWKGIIRLSKETLANTTKDLLVGARMLEALVKDGSEAREANARTSFAQMTDGFKLLRLLCENCWDYLYPMPEAGETMEVREGPFKWLNDATRGSRFPTTILNIPLFKSRGEPRTYFDYKNTAESAAFDEAFRGADGKKLKESYDDLQAAKSELQSLNQLLDEKMGESSPGMTSTDSPDNIGQALHKYEEVLEDLLKKKGISLSGDSTDGSGEASSEGGEGEGEGASGGFGAISVGKTNREALYRQLEQIANALQRIEPHSPVPFFLMRAVRLGALPFPELMKAIIRETATLDELNRLLGLDESAPPPSE